MKKRKKRIMINSILIIVVGIIITIAIAKIINSSYMSGYNQATEDVNYILNCLQEHNATCSVDNKTAFSECLVNKATEVGWNK